MNTFSKVMKSVICMVQMSDKRSIKTWHLLHADKMHVPHTCNFFQWLDVNCAHNCVVLYAQKMGKVGRMVNAKMCLVANVRLETDSLDGATFL